MTSAAVSEPSSRMSFKPTWMGGGQRGNYAKPGAGTYIQRAGQQSNGGPTQLLNCFGHGVTTIGAPTDSKDMAKPKMARNRFSREELLAIYQGQLGEECVKPPLYENFGEFVTTDPQTPISLTQMTEYEERTFHQMGINSSKSLSALSNETRTALGLPQSAPGFTPSWAQGDRASAMRGGYSSRGGRSGAMDSRGGRGGYVMARGRGGMMLTGTRNGNSDADQANSRAQGLYDPRDFRDRPRTRENIDTATSRGSWSRGYNVQNEHPEWLNDDDEDEFDENNIDGEHILRADRNLNDTTKKAETGVKQTLEHLFEKYQPARSKNAQTTVKTEKAETKVPTLAELEKSKQNLSAKRSASPDDFKHMHLLGESLINSFGLEDDGTEPVQRKPEKPPINTEQLNPAVQQLMKLDTESQQTNIPLSLFFGMQKNPAPKENAENIPSVGDILTHAANIVVQQRSQQSPVGGNNGTSASNVSPSAKTKPTYSSNDQWLYIDPKGNQQGPFPSEQMQAWCKAGYFALDLKLRRSTDPESSLVPLAVLMQMNNGRAPFVSNKDVNMQSYAAKQIAKQQEQHEVVAQQAREVDRERLQRAVEQRRQQIAREQQEQIEKQKRQDTERYMQFEEELKKIQEQKNQAQAIRKQAEEERAQQEAQQREKQQKQLAYQQAMQHYNKLVVQQKADEEIQRRKLADQQQQRAQQVSAIQQVREPYAPPSGRTIQLSELFGMPFAMPQKQQQTLSAWGQKICEPTAHAQPTVTRTLKEIQEEEERKEAARREDYIRIQAMRSQQTVAVAQQQGGAWSQVAAKHSSGQTVSQQLLQQQQRQGTVGWGTPASGKAVGLWDADSVANNQKAKMNAAQKTASLTMNQLEEQFKQWVIGQCRALDSTVDAEMFTQFLHGIDNPSEVEDYIFTYFKNDERTAQFKNLYLQRRSEYRLLKNQRQARDDLTTASAAIHHAHDSGNNLNALLIAQQQAKQPTLDVKTTKGNASTNKRNDNNLDSDSDFQVVGKGNKKNKRGKK